MRARPVTVPKAQQDPTLSRFDLRRFKISVKGGRLSVIAPSSMEPLVAQMQELDDRARNERMPFWAEIWPSSVGLARMLVREPELRGRHVVDLGCGVGVAGAAAASHGAASVLFVDFFDEALAFAGFNGRECRADEGTEIETLWCDWKVDRLPPGRDLLLLADCVYEPRNHEPILGILEAALEEGGEAWIVDPMRESAEPFFEEAARRFRAQVDGFETHWPDRSVPLRRLLVRA